MTTVLVTGATGFIGSHLLEYLLKHDFHVIAYSRQQKNSSNTQLQWIQDFSEIEKLSIDYVVNLAGESIGEGRWSEKRKQQLIQSRVETTAKLYQYFNQFQMKPKCIVSTSAIGFYGIDPEEKWVVECDEASPPQNIFMSELCQKWEAEALSHSDQNTKIMRLAVVFGKGGGILPQMLLPIKLNLIGKIGTGRQPMTWVHVDDVIQAILFLFKSDSSQQIYNVAATDHISQLQFVQIASQVLKRKPLLFLPSFVMKMLMGEQSQLVLNGQFVQPKALLKQGFQFQYMDLSNALKQIVSE